MKTIRTISLLIALLLAGGCGPMINILEVDVRQPASRPMNIMSSRPCTIPLPFPTRC